VQPFYLLEGWESVGGRFPSYEVFFTRDRCRYDDGVRSGQELHNFDEDRQRDRLLDGRQGQVL